MSGKRYVIGIDVGGTNIRTGLVDEEMTLRGFERRSSREVFAGGATEGLISHIRRYLEEQGLQREEAAAISIGFPSTLDKDRRVVLSTPNIAYLNDFRAADLLEEALGLPVFLNKDVNMLMLYDIRQMKIPTDGIITGFYIGTGIGNAICINGEILTGEHGAAAELGHIPVMDRSDPCGCSGEGCLELYASGKYLAQLCREKFPGVHISDIFETCAEDEDVKEFVRRAALPVASEINILDPGHVILGGGILQMKAFPRKLLEAQIRRYTRKPYPEAGLRFHYSQESQENGVIGAGIYAFTKMEA